MKIIYHYAKYAWKEITKALFVSSRSIYFRTIVFSASLLLLFAGLSHGATPDVNLSSLPQGFVILKNGNSSIALKEISREVFAEDARADIVFIDCIEALAREGGGEIRVGQGVYEFNRPVELRSSIKITGSGRATTFKPSSQNTDGSIFIGVNCDGVVLADFTCQGDLSNKNEKSAGIIFHGCGDCEIRSVFARDFSGYGFWLRNNAFLCRIHDCVSAGNGKAGYYISEINAGGRGGDYITNDIKNCLSYAERGNGFELISSLCVNIAGCNVYHAKGNGYYFRQGANSILLTGSRCFKAEGNGILVENSHELNVTGNIVCWNRGHGIELNHVIWGAVTGNEFIDSGGSVEPKKHGIYIHTDSRGLQVTGNQIFAWEDQLPMIYGIYENDDCQSNNITGNFINRYENEAIYSKGKGSLCSDNVYVRESYEKVYNQPFPEPRTEKVKPFPAFTRDDIEAYLNSTRR